jgi:hypothetical protein
LQKKRIKEEAIAEVQSCMKIEVEKVIAKQVASKQKQAVAPLPQAQVVSSIFSNNLSLASGQNTSLVRKGSGQIQCHEHSSKASAFGWLYNLHVF